MNASSRFPTQLMCGFLIGYEIETEIPSGAAPTSDHMTKEQLIDITKRLLGTDADLDFIAKLSKSELETLVAAVRNRVERFG